MLVLTRKLNESILIGKDVKITIVSVKGKQVRVGIQPPKDVNIHREELSIEKKQEEAAALKIIQKEELLAEKAKNKKIS